MYTQAFLTRPSTGAHVLLEARKTMVPKTCSVCFKTFHNKSNLNQHKARMHSNDGDDDSVSEDEPTAEESNQENEVDKDESGSANLTLMKTKTNRGL